VEGSSEGSVVGSTCCGAVSDAAAVVAVVGGAVVAVVGGLVVPVEAGGRVVPVVAAVAVVAVDPGEREGRVESVVSVVSVVVVDFFFCFEDFGRDDDVVARSSSAAGPGTATATPPLSERLPTIRRAPAAARTWVERLRRSISGLCRDQGPQFLR
jgi:hypothetical protein